MSQVKNELLLYASLTTITSLRSVLRHKRYCHLFLFTIFRASDIRAAQTSEWETAFTSITQILSWIFVIAYISGSLTSILVEMDTEKENFLTRRYAIERYLVKFKKKTQSYPISCDFRVISLRQSTTLKLRQVDTKITLSHEITNDLISHFVFI
jgi:hypothetical protein